MSDKKTRNATSLDFCASDEYNAWWNTNYLRLRRQSLFSKCAAVWNAALARATPQHSVTEKALDEAEIDRLARKHNLDSSMIIGHRHDYWRAFAADVIRAVRAKPLASTAATQPEQASDARTALQAYVDFASTRRGELGSLSPEMEAVDAQARAALAIPASTAASVYPKSQHPDDGAVDRFADAMKKKMAASRAKGRNGWDNEALCPADRLRAMLADHLAKGDPVDVGNFAMMLWNRGESTAASEQQAEQGCYCGGWIAAEGEEFHQVGCPEEGKASEQQASVSEADELLKSLWGDTGLRQLMRPDHVVKLERHFSRSAALSGRATIPSEADERVINFGADIELGRLLDAHRAAKTDHSVPYGETEHGKTRKALIRYLNERFRAALANRATTATPEGWKRALHAAVTALYFDDSSDFRSALGAVVRHLDAELAGELLGHPKAAYDKACAQLAAAPDIATTAEQQDDTNKKGPNDGSST